MSVHLILCEAKSAKDWQTYKGRPCRTIATFETWPRDIKIPTCKPDRFYTVPNMAILFYINGQTFGGERQRKNIGRVCITVIAENEGNYIGDGEEITGHVDEFEKIPIREVPISEFPLFINHKFKSRRFIELLKGCAHAVT